MVLLYLWLALASWFYQLMEPQITQLKSGQIIEETIKFSMTLGNPAVHDFPGRVFISASD